MLFTIVLVDTFITDKYRYLIGPTEFSVVEYAIRPDGENATAGPPAMVLITEGDIA